MALPPQSDPAYGDKTQIAEMQAANPLPRKKAEKSAAKIAEQAATQPAPEAPTEQQAQIPANRLALLPPEVLFAKVPGYSKKTPIERQYDAGLMWKAIAQMHDDPQMRAIARTLTQED